MSKNILNSLIALRESVETIFKNCISDMHKKFKSDQGLFQGERKTFQPREGFEMDYGKQGQLPVRSTVKAQLDYLEKTTTKFMDTVFSIEKTNASGKAVAELIVEGNSWGEYTSLELLRLKTTLENSQLKAMYECLPIRHTSDTWTLTNDEEYKADGVYENKLYSDCSRTSKTKTAIAFDPQVKDAPNRPPVTYPDTITFITGDHTVQKFSGALSEKDKAGILERLSILHGAVIIALNLANNVEPEQSDLGGKIFTYLHDLK